jgi:hypothetical protein
MNKLYDSINPVVIDDEILNEAVKDNPQTKQAERNGIQFSVTEAEYLRLSFKGWSLLFLLHGN